MPISVHGKDLETVDNAKLLGLNITSDLTWNVHLNEVIKKVSKRLYFLVQLKRACVAQNDLRLFYICCIKSILDYAAAVVSHYVIPKYLTQELEHVQKRAMSICLNLSYQYTLNSVNLKELTIHHEDVCNMSFTKIVSDKHHHLYKLLLDCNDPMYTLMHVHV